MRLLRAGRESLLRYAPLSLAVGVSGPANLAQI